MPIGLGYTGGPEWVKNYGIETEDATHYYFGFKQVGTAKWRIMRMLKADYTIEWAKGDNDGATAWTNRTSQSYGEM